MKKLICFLFVVLLFPIISQAAPGWDRGITVEWEYTPPADVVVAGFRLYQAGTKVCEWQSAEARAAECAVLITTKSTSFTLSAFFSDGEETPQSDPYILTDWGPKPRIIRVTAK